MRPGSPRTRWAVIGVLVLAAGPALGLAVYALPGLVWDSARALWVALPILVTLAVATWLESLSPSDWGFRRSIPTLLRGKAATGGASRPPAEGAEQGLTGGGEEPDSAAASKPTGGERSRTRTAR